MTRNLLVLARARRERALLVLNRPRRVRPGRSGNHPLAA